MASSYSSDVSDVNTYINFDGALLRGDKSILTADNRGFRYGDGLFETMKVADGRLLLADYHFERLLTGLRTLQFDCPPFFTPAGLTGQILELCKKNGHLPLARVRLVVFRGEGGLYDPVNHFPHTVIQSASLEAAAGALNTNGLQIGLFPEGRKSCDPFSNLKSNNYLLYVLAALYARKNRLNDCLVLNSRDRIADSTIANLFYCRDGKVYTPPLSEGCVAGVMRRYLMDAMPRAGFDVTEKPVTPEDLEGAEEVFLTNALRGIKWVQSFRDTHYNHQLSAAIYRACFPVATASGLP